jgi:hypothetical protein
MMTLSQIGATVGFSMSPTIQQRNSGVKNTLVITLFVVACIVASLLRIFSRQTGGFESKSGTQEPNLHLVGTMGASSTSPPIKWADPAGTTSEGLPAFIPTNTRMKSELMTRERKDDYVLGKTANGTGYFHLETKDAQEILFRRVDRQISALESEIACDQCCCELANNVKTKEDKLNKMKDVRSVLAGRMSAARPHGEVRTSSSRNVDDPYYGNGGVWL